MSMTFDKINLLVTKYNSRTNYFFTWIISKLSSSLSILEFSSKSNSIVVEVVNSFAFVNKSIKFVNNVLIKKKILDKNMLDASKNKKSSLITFDIGRIVDKNLNQLVRWSIKTRANVEIYAYKLRNAPLYLWKNGVATQDEKTKCS